MHYHYNSQKGTVLIVAVVTFVIIAGLSAVYLTLAHSNAQSGKVNEYKMRATDLAMAGVRSAAARMRDAQLDYNTAFGTTELKSTVLPISLEDRTPDQWWAGLAEFNDPVTESLDWKKFGNSATHWHTKTFADGSRFDVDMYANNAALNPSPPPAKMPDKIMVWSTGTYNGIEATAQALYEIQPPPPPYDPDDLGAFGYQGPPGQTIIDDDGGDTLPIRINGVNVEINGIDHDPEGVEVSPASGTNAITNNLNADFSIDPSGADPDTQVVGFDSNGNGVNDTTEQQNTSANDVRNQLDEIVARVKQNSDITINMAAGTVTNNETGDVENSLSLSGNTGDNIGAQNDYKTVYVSADLDNNRLRFSGGFEGYGLMVVEVDTTKTIDPSGTFQGPGYEFRGDDFTIDWSGGSQWHGLIIVKYLGNYYKDNADPLGMSGGAGDVNQIIGGFVMYVAGAYADFDRDGPGGANQGVAINESGTSGLLYSSEAVDQALNASPPPTREYLLKSMRVR